MRPGDWFYSLDDDEPCRIVDTEVLWNQATCVVWLPRRGTTVRTLQSRLASLKTPEDHLMDRLSFIGAAARIADTLERDALVSPLEGSVIPLPHQLHALQRAVSGDRVRYLLADEVGLGKTIEAGLILRELKIRGLVRRVLVVAPAGLVTQWMSEMKTHFHEDFRLVLPSNLAVLRQAAGLDEAENLWRSHDQVVYPLDSVKPIESRRGWTAEQLARHNRERFEDLTAAGWDLIIIDEAHRLGGSTEEVARFKLGEALAYAAPYLLPVIAPGQPVRAVLVPGVSDKVGGVWSLWRISLRTDGGRQQRILTLFVCDDGRVLGPTARAVWDRLIEQPPELRPGSAAPAEGTAAVTAFETSRRAAEAQGAAIFEELAAAHTEAVQRERRKGTFAFAARRRALERLAHAPVRAQRTAQLAGEERAWSVELAARAAALPELTAIVLLRVERAS